ncbi:MAG: vanadium-dependent haloperoxidase [Casimicrobiaceae bacterium]
MSAPAALPSESRRRFLGGVGGATAAAGFAGLAPLPKTVQAAASVADEAGPRLERAYQLRHEAALRHKSVGMPAHPANGDDELYPNRIGSFSKALPHDALGEVDRDAYKALLRAVSSGRPADFEEIPLGGPVKLRNPLGAFAFEMIGPDPHQLATPTAPAFGSAEAAGEMAEVYWQALTRDVPFSEYDQDPLANAAAADLSRFSDFRGPKRGGQVIPSMLFRGVTAGDAVGPYISQFLWQDVPYGATLLLQQIRTTVPGVNYMHRYDDWLAVQNGSAMDATRLHPHLRYVRTGRDLAEVVHRDFTYQLFLNAALILLGTGTPLDSGNLFGDRPRRAANGTLLGSGVPYDPGNPYARSRTQSGFATFGAPALLDLVGRVSNCGLKAAWYQKWAVHRRLRPEEFGGRIHNHLAGAVRYPIHADILNSPALETVYRKNGTYLLPMAYSEGSPTHPAYPSGHATMAGACATVLKAFFDEPYVLPTPMVPSANAEWLALYTQPTGLTVGGELDKLASNIAIGRNAAGVHWRTDAIEGLRLGEAVALGVLADVKGCFNEEFGGFSLTRFDGTTVVV